MSMTSWDDFCKGVRSTAKKINEKAEEWSELAALRIKLSSKRSQQEDELLALGQFTYAELNATQDDTTLTVSCEMQDVAARVAVLDAEIAALQQRIDALTVKEQPEEDEQPEA